ncbi:MAG: carboxypeptidase-like regulatory domain-containing protein [Gemmatimonadetes bacterium]|nr:carboxypeptidase-like regulatory domain-containing protein [Gemmatimonadota bacterium]
MSRALRAVALVCMAWLAPSVARAQGGRDALPPAAAGTLAGLVVDSAGVPVADIAVYLFELRRQERTDARGWFRFADVPKGKYTLTARSLGFLGATERVDVKAQGGVVRLRIARLDRALPAVITVASRGGLSGVVADTALRALRDVSVKVLGTGLTARTDSAGRFYLAAKPGRYLLRVEREGFTRQLIGVSVPEGEGREVAVWLDPAEGRENPLISANLFEFEQRRIRGRAVSYNAFSRDELMASGATDLMQGIARVTAQRPNFMSCAYLDGGPGFAPLWSIGVGEVEFVETMVPDNRGGVADILGRATNSRANCAVNVWLRR